MPCSRPRSSTSASTRSPRRRRTCATAGCPCGASRDARRAPLRRPGAAPGGRAGGGDGRAADGRLDGPRGRRGDARDGRDPLLVALARRAVAEGRDVGPHAARPGRLRRLRPRHAARAGPPGGRRLPHRRAPLLLPGARPRRDGRPAAGPHARASGAHDRGAQDDPARRLVRRRAARGGAGGDLPQGRRGGHGGDHRGARRRGRPAHRRGGRRPLVPHAGAPGGVRDPVPRGARGARAAPCAAQRARPLAAGARPAARPGAAGACAPAPGGGAAARPSRGGPRRTRWWTGVPTPTGRRRASRRTWSRASAVSTISCTPRRRRRSGRGGATSGGSSRASRRSSDMDAYLRRATIWYGGVGLLTGRVCRSLALPPKYFRVVVREVEVMGVQSLGVALIAAVFTGMVFTIQSAVNMARFGAESYVGPIAALAILRELGPVLTAILVGGKVASGITAPKR